jgi:hypothetical protein
MGVITMSKSESTPADAPQFQTAASTVPLTNLVEREGTVPFLGMNSRADADYPDAATIIGPRRVGDNPQSFKEALDVLPHPSEGDLWADNQFVTQNGSSSTVDVDLNAIKDIHGLDTEELEKRTGRSLKELVKAADPEPLIPVDTNKDIIDKRRLALHTLGYDCKFRWQIASSRYDPGNMREFFKRKIAACQQHNADDAFGWIRHHDWGGSVTITTIYPSMAYEVGMPDDTDVDLREDEITIADNPLGQSFDEADSDGSDETITIYYGDRMGYDFRGTQKLWAKPVIFVPSAGTMIPIPYDGTDLSRKHTGDLMEDAIEWHEKILTKIDGLCESINQTIVRARIAALDFEELPFDIEDFYRFVGIKNDTYCEKAAERARALAEPVTQPTLWNLQLSLKLAILDNYEGSKAGKTYQDYQEIAGQILRYPSTQIQMALEQYEYEKDATDEDESLIDEEQQTLAESLGDVIDLDGVTENRLDATEAQKIESRVQQRLPADGS